MSVFTSVLKQKTKCTILRAHRTHLITQYTQCWTGWENTENWPCQCRKHVWNVLIMSKSILNLNLIIVQTRHIYSQAEAKPEVVIVNCPTKKAFSWLPFLPVHLCHKINIFWHFKVRNISFLCKCETLSFLHLDPRKYFGSSFCWL